MPQLDFIWWIINFFLIWLTVLFVTIILINNNTPSEIVNKNSPPLKISEIEKQWQWL